MSSIASLVYDESGRIAILRFPYSLVVVNRLKTVPYQYREWVPELKVWRVMPPYDRMAAQILRDHFPDAVIEERPTATPQWERATQCDCQCSDAHRRLYVLPDAPEPVVKAVYRVLAKSQHPDHGGTHESMLALTAAFEEVLEGARR